MYQSNRRADMAELADALDLGSSVFDVGFKSLYPHQVENLTNSREWLSGRALPC